MRGFVVVLGLACLAAAVPAPEDEVLHKMMTKDEVMQVFRTEPHAVPEYEVVPVEFPKEHKRAPGSATNLHIKAFGRDIKLWLHPSEGILAGEDTPVYVTRSNPVKRNKRAANFKIYRVPDAMANVGKMLEDREKQATIILRKLDNGKDSISGIVGSERLVVRPLPSRVNEHYSRRFRRSADDSEESLTMIRDEAHYHVVYKLPEQDPKSRVVSMPVTEEFIEKHLNRSRREVTVPDIIYPQVLIFADYSTYKLHGQNIYTLLEYLMPFWNGVDLRYRTLVSPTVRFNIAAIIIGQDEHALPFVSLQSTKTMWIDETLEKLTKFLPEIETVVPKSSYDLAVAMGPYEMCDTKDGNCQILGLAYRAGACSQQRTGVVMDMGAFDGIDTAVHEIGHLFGSGHDGFADSKACDANDGYLMTPNSIRTSNVADWSPCSLKAFDKFFKNLDVRDPTCLFNEPKTTHPLPLVLPGRLMTLDEQCQALSGTNYCYALNLPEDQMCIKLPCHVKNNNRSCSIKMAPVDGTICADNKVCLHGKCVDQSLFV